jgi:aldose 1-epimerase
MSLGGDELQLRHGDLTAVVTEVGGGLRLLRHRDRDLVLPYRRDEVRPRYRGAVLAPWVNRVVDGRYEFDGAVHQLDINEPERHHALHGLVCWVRWEALDVEESAATLMHRVVPQPGYPFEVELRATYSLADDGLTCTVTGRNVGSSRAPYGAAGHPYVLGASGTLDTWTLRLPAARYLEVTADRLVPTGTARVQGGRKCVV